MGRLDDVDLSRRLSREEQDRLLELHGRRLAQLRLALGGLIGSGELGPSLCVLFEGWDASGKGGAIKRLVAPLDARDVRVKQFAAPTRDEKRHHYLHRFVSALPGAGGMAVLDRTWYGRVSRQAWSLGPGAARAGDGANYLGFAAENEASPRWFGPRTHAPRLRTTASSAGPARILSSLPSPRTQAERARTTTRERRPAPSGAGRSARRGWPGARA
jgi:polyphosphate kinase 2 PPK2